MSTQDKNLVHSRLAWWCVVQVMEAVGLGRTMRAHLEADDARYFHVVGTKDEPTIRVYQGGEGQPNQIEVHLDLERKEAVVRVESITALIRTERHDDPYDLLTTIEGVEDFGPFSRTVSFADCELFEVWENMPRKKPTNHPTGSPTIIRRV